MKKILKINLFIIFFILIFFTIQKVFIPYNVRIKRWDSFYQIPKNNLDVVFLGSSHSYTTYYPEMLDNKLKINSFNMASNSQHIDQLYFNLKEILKYQNPKIVFIELFSLSADSREREGNWFIYDNLDGQKFSLNKLNSILSYRKKGNRLDSLFPLIRSHQDWKDKVKLFKNISNRNKDKNNIKIFSGFERAQSEMDKEITQKYQNEAKKGYNNFVISKFNKDYLKKIQDLSKKYNFTVIYLYSPMYRDFINPHYKEKYIKFKEIAEIYADDLLDFNMIGKDLDITERCFENGYISYQHTSFYGARKITNYLINYLEKNYKFQSREKEKYWQKRNKIKGVGYEKSLLIAKEEIFTNITIKDILYIPENANKGILEIRFDSNVSKEELSKYRLKVHALPKNKDEKKLLKNGYQNWDMAINLKEDKDYFYIYREVEPKLKEYVLNIALYQVERDKNNKIVRYPNFGKQLYIEFKNK